MAACGLLAVGCSEQAADTPLSGPSRGEPSGVPAADGVVPTSASVVADEFDAVCTRLQASSNAYYGRAQIEELEGWLAQPTADPTAQAIVRARLAMELLRIGDEARAVALLTEARQLAERADLDLSLRRDVTRRLGLAHLRAAEAANCIAGHHPRSCIVPIRGGGVHRDPSHATKAVEVYLAYAAQGPVEPTVAWLMHVAARTSGQGLDLLPAEIRVDRARLEGAAFPQFVNEAHAVGLHAMQASGGAVVDDFDGDGDFDIVTSSIDPCASMQFWRNDGSGRFSEDGAAAGLQGQRGGLNLTHADYDNDGDHDLLVLRGGWFGSTGRLRNSLLRNDDGRFVDVTRGAGLEAPAFPTQVAAWADYDTDGDLDLFVGNEADDAGRAYPSQLFRNEGDGRFVDVAAAAGVTNDRMCKGASWGDYDDDGDPDLYVSNLGPNRLYRNEGDGRFVDVAETLGVTEPAQRSFPTWFFDYDNDGDLDLFVADYGAPLDAVAAHYLGLEVETGHPRLYRNDAGRFQDVSAAVGLDLPALPMGANFGDLDNDGFLDFYLGTGTPSFESISPNLMFRNVDGRRFDNVTFAGGFGHLQKGHGVAFADIDGDGDQDVIEQMGGAYPGDAYPSALYRNPGAPGHWIALQLVGIRSNRSGVGARVRAELRDGAGMRTVHRRVGTGGSFGGSPLRLHLGLGAATEVERLEVRWPAGTVQAFRSVRADRAYRIVEDAPGLRPIPGSDNLER